MKLLSKQDCLDKMVNNVGPLSEVCLCEPGLADLCDW